MRQNWFRLSCGLLVAFGTLGFSTSVAAAAEAGKAVVAPTNVRLLPTVMLTVQRGPIIAGSSRAR